MTRRQQIDFALKHKRAGEKSFQKAWKPVIKEITALYRLGDTVLNADSKYDIYRILKSHLQRISNKVVGFDMRFYKAVEETLYQKLARQLSGKLSVQVEQQTNISYMSITATIAKYINNTSINALENGWTTKEARTALKNYLNNESVTIGVSSTNWAVENARMMTVFEISDPLEDSLSQISEYIKTGRYNEARKLAAEVVKLGSLPTSISQGKVINELNDWRGTIQPLTQRSNLAALEKMAEELEANTKSWQTIGDNHVRFTHDRVNGQKQPIDQPYQLPGGLLMMPGDSSLGASLGEIIHCRCVSCYD